MDVTRSFKYVFEDKDWIKKVLIGGVLNIIPLVGQVFMVGYGLRQFKKMTEGQELPLPEWNDWGGDLQRGIMVLIGYLGYAVPIIILSIFTAIFSAFAAGAVRNGNSAGFWLLCNGIIGLIQAIYGIAVAIWAPAALVNYIKEGKLAAFFKFADILAIIKTNTKEYITLVIMWLIATVVASIVGGILCGIGTLFTVFIANLVFMHLLGQFYNTIYGAAAPFSTTPVAQ